MTCPTCRADNRHGAAFCRACGEPLAGACAACGGALAPGDRFCDACGAAAPAARRRPRRLERLRRHFPAHLARTLADTAAPLEGERKQVTVLFCNIANSMALAERLGAEQMHALLNDFFALALAEVRAYEGAINQFLGDGFMALFGAPVAQEGHERLAVLAALAIDRATAQREADLLRRHGAGLRLRMGLHTGPVVVGRVGDSARVDYTAVGDTTNLASRLQQAAEPGAILVSEAVAVRAAEVAALQRVGPLRLKGRSEPVAAFRVTGRRPRSPGAPGRPRPARSPFVGRERELAAVAEAFAAARGGSGRVVAVSGEAGAGKSRLVTEIRDRLGGPDVLVLEGHCVSHGTLAPYLPVLDMLRELTGTAEGDPPDVVEERVREALVRAGADAAAVPDLTALLGVADGPPREPLAADAARGRTFEALRRLLLGAGRHEVVALVVENVHWIDRISEEFLASLVDAIPAARAVLIVTYRPGYRARWLQKAPASRVALAPLGDDGGAAVVRAVAGETLPDGTVEAIVRRAEGNPFFLEELTRAITEHRDLGIHLELPDTVHEVLTARIDRLSGEAKRLLQTAAVLGRAAPLRVLGELGDDRHGLDRPLRELRRAELLYERADGDEILCVFKHALVQEAARASLLAARRQGLHAAAAGVLERLYAARLDAVDDRLAYHWSMAGDSDRAVRHLSRLADRAARWYAHADAVAALGQALAHLDRTPESADRERRRLRLSLRQAQSLHFLGSFDEILALLLPLRATAERLGDPALTGELHVRLGRTYDVLGDHARAVESARIAIDAARRCGDDAIAGKAYFVLAYVGYWSGHPREGVEHGRRAIALLEPGGERWWLGQAHWVVALNLIILGDLHGALAAGARAQAIAEAIGDRRLLSSVAWSTGAIHALTGEWETAVARCRRALELAPDPLSRAVAEGVLGAVHVERGDHAVALPLLESAVRQLEHFRLRQTAGWFLTLLAEARLFSGDVEGARGAATAGLEMTLAVAHRHGAAWAHRTLARIADAAGKPADADAHYRAACETFASIDARFEQARTHLEIGEAAAIAGRLDAGRAALDETRRLAAGLAFGRYADRLARLAAAVAPEGADAP